MKQFVKRTLGLLLVLVMCLGMIPTVGAEEKSTTISFASKAQRTSFSTSVQVWENSGVKLTNNKSSSTSNVGDYFNPARFYASSNLVIDAPGNITKIVFDCNSSSYANALKTSIGTSATTSVSSDKVTVTLGGTSSSFTVAKLSAQRDCNICRSGQCLSASQHHRDYKGRNLHHCRFCY